MTSGTNGNHRVRVWNCVTGAETYPFILSLAITIQGIIFAVSQSRGLDGLFASGCSLISSFMLPGKHQRKPPLWDHALTIEHRNLHCSFSAAHLWAGTYTARSQEEAVSKARKVDSRHLLCCMDDTTFGYGIDHLLHSFCRLLLCLLVLVCRQVGRGRLCAVHAHVRRAHRMCRHHLHQVDEALYHRDEREGRSITHGLLSLCSHTF